MTPNSFLSVRFYALAGLGLMLLVVWGLVLAQTGGHFTYSLDDPYIHLAVAENMPRNYSIDTQAGAPSATSSSILYPWMLMPLAQTGLAYAAPLLLNVIASCVVVLALVRLIEQCQLLPNLAAKWRAMLAIVFATLFNVITLVFAGLEHTLHIAASLAILSGLIDLAEGRAAPRWFYLALVLNPLFRFEGIALTGLAVGYLCYRRSWLYAAGVVACLILAFVLHGIYMHAQGLPFMPSSVLTKSAFMTSVFSSAPLGLSAIELLLNMVVNFIEPAAWINLLQVFVLLGLLCSRHTEKPQKQIALIVLLASIAHLSAGKFGWLDRYQAYIFATNTMAIFYVGRSAFLQWQARFKMLGVLVVCLIVAAGASSVRWLYYTPEAARQIYTEHAQLHRFTTDYWQDTIVTGDIGYLAWQNPYRIVDLVGLSSEAIRQILLAPNPIPLLHNYINKAGAQLLIIDTYTFRKILRPDWILLAEYHIQGPKLLVPRTQHFFLTNPARRQEAQDKLRAFKATLPEGSELQLFF